MTPVQCRTCRHFIPWPPNPEQAVGECGKGHGYHFAGETHRCVDHQSRPDMTSILMKIGPESKNKAV